MGFARAAAITDSGENPYKSSAPYEPAEWIVTLFVVPFLTAVAGVLAWRAPKGSTGTAVET